MVAFSFLFQLLDLNLLYAVPFEIQQRFQVTIERTKDIAEYTNGFLQKLLEESKSLENYAVQADENQMKSIADFQKAYEV